MRGVEPTVAAVVIAWSVAIGGYRAEAQSVVAAPPTTTGALLPSGQGPQLDVRLPPELLLADPGPDANPHSPTSNDLSESRRESNTEAWRRHLRERALRDPKAMAQRDRSYAARAGQRLGYRHPVAENVDLGWSLWTDLNQSATLSGGDLGALGVGTTALGLLDELKAAAGPGPDEPDAGAAALPFAATLRLNLRFPPPER